MMEQNTGKNAAIRVENLVKTFKDVRAVDGISFTANEGELFAFLGENGAGKSTLLSLLMGFCRPDAGRILVDDIDLRDMDLKGYRSQIAVVPQNTILFSGTLRDNIAYAAPDATDEEILAVIDEIGLRDMVDRLPKGIYTNLVEHGGNFSGGQRQRIAIARALIRRPRLIIFDEATSALDPKTTRQILELIKDINRKLGITVVIITHQMSVVEEICNKVAILDNGEVAEEGEVSTVFAHPKSEAARRLVMPDNTKDFLPGLTGDHVLRVVFNGALAAGSPLITQMAIDKGIAANILYASTRCIGDKVYGNMLLGLPSDEGVVKEATAYLSRKENVLVQEVTKDVQ